ncbi:hypothetical protein G6011_09757 [Alternaria panax]|uniref:Uncharacterized protein n=1 Tax=Alternaria panax TaxID=48097 RepID=A0AAD4FFL9_9PLEO|nr:hypothetical protein G6011_09757 [Alternaria panax]
MTKDYEYRYGTPTKVMKKDAHIVASSAYMAVRSLDFLAVMKSIVEQIEDLTVASVVTYMKTQMM